MVKVHLVTWEGIIMR